MDTLFQENMETDEIPSILGQPEEWAGYPLGELGKLHQRGWKYHTQLHKQITRLSEEQQNIQEEIHQLETAIRHLCHYMETLPLVSKEDITTAVDIALDCLEHGEPGIAKGLMGMVREALV